MHLLNKQIMVQRVKLADNPQLCLPLIVLHMTSCGQAQGRTTDGRMIISASCVITLQSFSERGDINCSTSSLCCRKKIEFASECNVYVTIAYYKSCSDMQEREMAYRRGCFMCYCWRNDEFQRIDIK